MKSRKFTGNEIFACTIGFIIICASILNLSTSTNVEKNYVIIEQFLEDGGIKDQEQIKKIINGIDLNEMVFTLTLDEDAAFCQYQVDGKQGNFYGGIYSTPDKLGISAVAFNKETSTLKNKQKKYYSPNQKVEVLISYAKSIEDSWSIPGQIVIANGGGLQYFSLCKPCFDEVVVSK